MAGLEVAQSAEGNIGDSDEPLSLVGAAALWSGLVQDFRILHSLTLVLEPQEGYDGAELASVGEPVAGAVG